VADSHRGQSGKEGLQVTVRHLFPHEIQLLDTLPNA
jgi:hypothetical protein